MKNTAELEITTSVQLVLIEASNLSSEDEFMSYEPKTEEEQNLKKELIKVIENGTKNFWTTVYDPCYSENGKIIYFSEVDNPATGKTFEWWKKTAKTYSRYNKSRLGKISEYTALLGVLIKKLIENGWIKEEAWKSVCSNPSKVIEFMAEQNSKLYLEGMDIEEVFKLRNLDSTKIVADDSKGYWIVANKLDSENFKSLTNMDKKIENEEILSNCTGWIVFGR